MKILVVEDNGYIAYLFSELLLGEGHEVLLAGNGREALEVLLKHDVDVIFLDLQMPVMSGVELLQTNVAIKERLFPSDFKIIIMTATPQLAPFGYPILHKPFSIDDALGYLHGN